MTSRSYSTKLTANLRAQIDSGDPGLSFGYLTILIASIVIELIAIFCENSPILRKFDLFWPPVTSNLTWSKKMISVFFVELATAYSTPFTTCRYLSKFSSSLGAVICPPPPPGRAKVAQTPSRARVKCDMRDAQSSKLHHISAASRMMRCHKIN